ncbi:MAG: PrgI family protein [Actinobacteria bacterium]|nr:PrgI family protein [Actinomycetota bacterium]
MTTTNAKTLVPTVRFGRRSTRGVMLGLSAPRVAALAVALVIALPAVYLAGFTGLVWTTPAWGLAVASAWVTIGSRTAVEWLPIYGHWVLRRTLGQHLYRVRVLKPRPKGTLALPGDAARLRYHHDPVTGAAMIHDPVANTLTAAARVHHPSFYLLAGADQARRVTGWGRALATCCASGRIGRVQVLERTMPDTGEGIRQYWAEHGRSDGGWAATQYQQLIEHAGPASERHETTISITVDLTRTRRAVRAHGGGITGAAAVLRQEMTTVAAALHAAELAVDGWVEPDDLAGILRLAYDPAAVHRLDRARVGRDLDTAGPTLVTEDLDHLRTDSGYHCVYWISEWPRSEVHPSFLHHLLIAPGVRRTFSLVAQPLTTAEAMRSLRKERVEYQADAVQRQRIGQITDYATEQEWADVNQRERELVAGHGDLRYAGFLSVTAPTLDALQDARATIEQAAVNVGCETRLLLGQQAQAFAAAALPLGRGI